MKHIFLIHGIFILVASLDTFYKTMTERGEQVNKSSESVLTVPELDRGAFIITLLLSLKFVMGYVCTSLV